MLISGILFGFSLEAHAKFLNPSCLPSCREVRALEEQKITTIIKATMLAQLEVFGFFYI
jgi:hypothetical protein